MDRFTRPICRNRSIILAYHGFTNRRHERIENYQKKHLDIDSFSSHMEHLKRFYNVIPLARLVESYRQKRDLPPNAAVITIDDGYESNYSLAYPVLKKFDVPATIFLTAGFIDTKRPLWVDRIEYALNKAKPKALKLRIEKKVFLFDLGTDGRKKMCDRRLRAALKRAKDDKKEGIIGELEYNLDAKLSMDDATPSIYRPLEWYQVVEMSKNSLISIGSHTSSHMILTRCTGEDAKKEVLSSKRLIEEKTGLNCDLFSYPNGGAGDFDARTKKTLIESGYSCGITNISGLNSSSSDLFELRRFGMSEKGDLSEFKSILAWKGLARGAKRKVSTWIHKKNW